jgi:transposase
VKNDEPIPPPAQALLDVLKAVTQNQKIWTELAADVAALKIVVSALSPQVRAALDEQIAIARDKFRELGDSQRILSELLRSGFPKKGES